VIDREKVMAVLEKRFPGARLCDLAAAANAIVGLSPEFDIVPPADLSRFHCDTRTAHFTASDVRNGDLRLYYRVKR
jgi:hypothetical protein